MAVAGWYTDPDASHQLRWWDGHGWSEWVSAQGRTWAQPLGGQDAVVTPAAPAPVVTAPPRYPQPSVPQAPYPQPTYPQPTYPQPTYPQPTYPQPTYPQPGYPSPASSIPTAPPVGYVWDGGAAPGERFRSLKGLTVALLVLFIATAVAYTAVSITLLNRADTFSRADSGFVPAQEVMDADDAVAGSYALASMCEIAIFVLLIIWLWRAYSNTRVFGVGPWRWGRGWTVGAWFIPLANLVIPKVLINDAWRGTDGRAPGNPVWRKLPVAGVVTMWWVLFVIGRIAVQVGDAGATVTEDLGDVVAIDRVTAGLALVCTAGCILGAVAVWKLFRRQHDRAAELGLA